jgi:hypothetical protein
MRIRRFLLPCVALALLGCKPTIEDTYGALPPIGSVIPDFRYSTADGALLTPATLRGQPAVIALWATTCSASRLALASMGALEKEYASRGARVVVLADDQDLNAVVAAFARAGVHTPVALASHTLIETFTHAQSVLPWRKAFALPTFLVIEATGRVRYRQIGIEQEASQQLARVRTQLDSLMGLYH